MLQARPALEGDLTPHALSGPGYSLSGFISKAELVNTGPWDLILNTWAQILSAQAIVGELNVVKVRIEIADLLWLVKPSCFH